jgi:hypothetical protein
MRSELHLPRSVDTMGLLESSFASLRMEFMPQLVIALLTCSFVGAQWLAIPAEGDSARGDSHD